MVWIASVMACVGTEGETGDPCDAPGAICTWVGTPEAEGFGEDGVDRLDFGLYLPIDAEPTPDGGLLVADFNNHRVVRVDPAGPVDVVVGTGLLGDGPGGDTPTGDCWDGCDVADYAFNHPTSMVADPVDPDVVWVAAWLNGRVVRVDSAAAEVRWWAGNGLRDYAAGDRTEIATDMPSSLAVDPATGDVYFSDTGNQLIRAIRADGTVDDVAGSPRIPGFAGDGCLAEDALLHSETGRAASAASRLALSDGTLYLADSANGVIRAIDLETGRIGTVAGRYDPDPAEGGGVGAPDPSSRPGYGGDGGDALVAQFARPLDVAVGPEGSLYVADTENHCVRRVDPVTGTVEAFAGQCTVAGFGGDGGPATEAFLDTPSALGVDADGNVFVVDMFNHVVRRIAAVHPPDGVGHRIVPPSTPCEG